MNATLSHTVTEAFAHGVSILHRSDVPERFVTLGRDFLAPAGRKGGRVWRMSESEWADVLATVDAALTFLADALSMGKLSDTTDVTAWTYDGATFCADHGAILPAAWEGDSDGAWPVFTWDTSELNAAEWCDYGHSFCGNCGSDMESTRGAHDRDFSGNFARCWNCHNESVYQDGEGWQYVAGWDAVTDSFKVQAYVGADANEYPLSTDRNHYVTITDTIDRSGTILRNLAAWIAWRDVDPAAGVVLILVTGTESNDHGVAYVDDEATEHFRDKLEAADDLPADDEEESDFRASIRYLRIPTDQIWFSTK